MKTAFQGLRSGAFYIGFLLSLVVHACLSVALGLFMSLRTRYRFFLQWNRFLMWWLKITCGVRTRITGIENLPGEPCVMLSNHQSTCETLYFYYLFQPISAILKKELLSLPFFGWGLRMLHPVAIDRSKKRQAREALFREGSKRLAEGISVLVFPEGTRLNPGEIRKFSSGGAELAIRAGVKVVPVAHNAGHFWPAHRIMKYPGTLDVVIGEPIDPTGRTAKDVTREAEEWIRQALR